MGKWKIDLLPRPNLSNGVELTAAADRTNGQQDTQAHCSDRRLRETGNGAERKWQSDEHDGV